MREREIKKSNNNLGTTSLTFGLLTFIYMNIYLLTFKQHANFFILIILLVTNILGIIISFISLFQEVNKKIISFWGMLLNLITIFYIVFSVAVSIK